jgi:hypoxanthine phosphoribosyltransferase
MKTVDDKYYYSYDDIHHLIKSSSSKLNEFNPDIILAIGGGGLIPARILRNYLNKPIYVITVKGYDENDNISSIIETIQWLDMDLNNKKILIVDEIDDTRHTLKYCVDQLKQKNNANKIGIFVIHNKIKDKVWDINENIFYHPAITIEDNWVVYPWDSNL